MEWLTDKKKWFKNLNNQNSFSQDLVEANETIEWLERELISTKNYHAKQSQEKEN